MLEVLLSWGLLVLDLIKIEPKIKAYMENTSPKSVSKDTYGIKVGKGADKKSYATKSDINETTEGSKSSWTEKFNNSVKTIQEKIW